MDELDCGTPLLMQVACGGFHTLAVVRHDPREAGEDAARRSVRQWAKPKPELTVGVRELLCTIVSLLCRTADTTMSIICANSDLT